MPETQATFDPVGCAVPREVARVSVGEADSFDGIVEQHPDPGGTHGRLDRATAGDAGPDLKAPAGERAVVA